MVEQDRFTLHQAKRQDFRIIDVRPLTVKWPCMVEDRHVRPDVARTGSGLGTPQAPSSPAVERLEYPFAHRLEGAEAVNSRNARRRLRFVPFPHPVVFDDRRGLFVVDHQPVPDR